MKNNKPYLKYSCKTIILTFVLMLILALISIKFIDRPLALFIYNNYPNLDWLSYISENICTYLFFVVIFILAINRQISSIVFRVIHVIYFAITIEISISIKDILKSVFARYWPMTWKGNNLSLIHNHIYGFNWFGDMGLAGGCFPSGHSWWAAFCVVWLCYYSPKLAIVWLSLLAITVASLILQNFHFLGDCIAGVAIGSVFATIAIIIWEFFYRRISH